MAKTPENIEVAPQPNSQQNTNPLPVMRYEIARIGSIGRIESMPGGGGGTGGTGEATLTGISPEMQDLLFKINNVANPLGSAHNHFSAYTAGTFSITNNSTNATQSSKYIFQYGFEPQGFGLGPVVPSWNLQDDKYYLLTFKGVVSSFEGGHDGLMADTNTADAFNRFEVSARVFKTNRGGFNITQVPSPASGGSFFGDANGGGLRQSNNTPWQNYSDSMTVGLYQYTYFKGLSPFSTPPTMDSTIIVKGSSLKQFTHFAIFIGMFTKGHPVYQKAQSTWTFYITELVDF